MSRWIAGLVACLALLAAGCGSIVERNGVRDDLRRFRDQRSLEFVQIKRDLERYVADNKLRAQELPIDLDHFLRWQRREWWNLTEEVAAVLAYEREAVFKLVDGAARCYGYEVRNFPVVTEDIARFFRNAEPEYLNLVKDVVMFLAVQERELLPLRREIRDCFTRVAWESASLAIDLRTFMQWREREWNKLGDEARAVVVVDSQLGLRLREDLRRFRAARALEGRLLVADLKAYWHHEAVAMPPRMIDDLYRWSTLPPQEYIRLRAEVAQFGEGIGEDAMKLVDDVGRYAKGQLDQVPLLVLDVEDFFAYSRIELTRLDAGVRRFWRSNVALGILSIEDMRLFFIEHTREEAAELQASLRRFVSYAGKEWKDFRGAIARFCWDDSARAFGDRNLPLGGSPPGGDDPRIYPVRGYDAGDE